MFATKRRGCKKSSFSQCGTRGGELARKERSLALVGGESNGGKEDMRYYHGQST